MKGGDFFDHLTPQELKVLVCLNEDENKIQWNPREGSSKETKRWNTRYAGKTAFDTINKYGYLFGKVSGKNIYAHRVVYCLIHGHWPCGFIDHIDGNKANNNIDNLRVVSKKENNKNASLRKDNKTGITGVTVRNNKFVVNIKDVSGKQISGGAFCTLEEATVARKALEERFLYHKNHGKYFD